MGLEYVFNAKTAKSFPVFQKFGAYICIYQILQSLHISVFSGRIYIYTRPRTVRPHLNFNYSERIIFRIIIFLKKQLKKKSKEKLKN